MWPFHRRGAAAGAARFAQSETVTGSTEQGFELKSLVFKASLPPLHAVTSGGGHNYVLHPPSLFIREMTQVPYVVSCRGDVFLQFADGLMMR